jgi:hypothetical protein
MCVADLTPRKARGWIVKRASARGCIQARIDASGHFVTTSHDDNCSDSFFTRATYAIRSRIRFE